MQRKERFRRLHRKNGAKNSKNTYFSIRWCILNIYTPLFPQWTIALANSTCPSCRQARNNNRPFTGDNATQALYNPRTFWDFSNRPWRSKTSIFLNGAEESIFISNPPLLPGRMCTSNRASLPPSDTASAIPDPGFLWKRNTFTSFAGTL